MCAGETCVFLHGFPEGRRLSPIRLSSMLCAYPLILHSSHMDQQILLCWSNLSIPSCVKLKPAAQVAPIWKYCHGHRPFKREICSTEDTSNLSTSAISHLILLVVLQMQKHGAKFPEHQSVCSPMPFLSKLATVNQQFRQQSRIHANPFFHSPPFTRNAEEAERADVSEI